MTWLGLIGSLVSLALAITRWAKERDLVRAAEAVLISQQLQAARDAVDKARAARVAAVQRARSGGLHDDDGFRRD